MKMATGDPNHKDGLACLRHVTQATTSGRDWWAGTLASLRAILTVYHYQITTSKSWFAHKSSQEASDFWITKLPLEMRVEQLPTTMRVQLTMISSSSLCYVVLAANQQATWTISMDQAWISWEGEILDQLLLEVQLGQTSMILSFKSSKYRPTEFFKNFKTL